MAAPIRPDGVQAFGKEKWVWVTTLANPAAPTAAEINAASSLDLSGVLYAEQFEGVTIDTSRVTAPRRVMDTTLLSRLGTSTHNLSDLVYAVQPQAASGSDGKKAFETLDEGALGYAIHVPGVDPDEDVAAGDFVTVIPGELGEPNLTKTSNGEEGEFAVRQPVGVTGAVHTLVPVV